MSNLLLKKLFHFNLRVVDNSLSKILYNAYVPRPVRGTYQHMDVHMKSIFDLIEKLKSEGNNLAVLIIDEQDYSKARE